MRLKRNQIEEAISRSVGERFAQPSLNVKTRLKRLLDVDRKLAASADSRFAFCSRTPGGKGAETSYSVADACALFLGLRMLDHGWPQYFVVSNLQTIRSNLARRHDAILRRPAEPSDRPREAGEMAFGGPASDFLLVVSDMKAARNNSNEPYVRLFDSERDAFKFQLEELGRSCSWFSLEGPARILHEQLLSAPRRERGRSA